MRYDFPENIFSRGYEKFNLKFQIHLYSIES